MFYLCFNKIFLYNINENATVACIVMEILQHDERIKRSLMSTRRFIYIINPTNHSCPGIRQVNVMFSYERRNYDNQNIYENYLSVGRGLLLPGGKLTRATSTSNLASALIVINL